MIVMLVEANYDDNGNNDMRLGVELRELKILVEHMEC